VILQEGRNVDSTRSTSQSCRGLGGDSDAGCVRRKRGGHDWERHSAPFQISRSPVLINSDIAE
jgi:hypothetical protein